MLEAGQRMNFRQSLTYLNSFVNLEKIVLNPRNRLMNLDRMRYLLALFGHPEESFFPVVISGTKGKGSTGFFLQAILKEAGIPAGFYSSPHLETPRERIRVGARNISEKQWARILTRIQKKLGQEKFPRRLGDLTYFEMMTLMAVLAFQESGLRVGIFEVGMGGRLDAVNALDAELSIVTTIGLDHEAFLGNTTSKIAKEKAGIFRKGAWALLAPQDAAAWRALMKQAGLRGTTLEEVRPLQGYRLGLPGEFQKVNAALAVRASELLKTEFGFEVLPSAVRKGLLQSGWPGRLEVFPGKPEVVIDAAHNPASAEALAEAVSKNLKKKRNILVFGVSRDKKSGPMLKSLSRVSADAVLTQASAPRSQDVAVLMKESQGLFPRIFPAPNCRTALSLAKTIARPQDRILVTGSFYLAGEARTWLSGQRAR